MPQNLRLLDAWIPNDAWPHIACPVCLDGSLNPDRLTHQESAESTRWHGDEDWDPEWIEGTFQGLLRCNRPSCDEPISVAGDYSVDRPLPSGRSRQGDWADFYRLRYARPALTLITCPEGTPETVSSAIQRASKVIWLDPGASANRLRMAVEELLTDKGVRRSRIANGRRLRLTAHARIQEFKKQAQEAGEALEAVKWIGNEGSHADRLTPTLVIDGAEMLEHALRLVYDKRGAKMQRSIKAINKARGIPGKAVVKGRTK